MLRRRVTKVLAVASVASIALVSTVVAAPSASADSCSGSAGSFSLDITLDGGVGCLSDPGQLDPQASYLAAWTSWNDGAVWSNENYCTAGGFDKYRTYKWVGGSMGTHTYTWWIDGLFHYVPYYVGAYIDTCNATATVTYYVMDALSEGGWRYAGTINQAQTSGLKWLTGPGGEVDPLTDGSGLPNDGWIEVEAVSSGPAVTALGASDLQIEEAPAG